MLVKAFALSYASLWLLMFIPGLAGQKVGSYGVKASSEHLAFRKPWEQRVFMAMLSLAVFLVPAMPAIDLAQRHLLGSGQSWVIPAFGLLFLPASLGFLWMAGPNDLTLDLSRHSYRRASGWPFRPQIQSGPWNEMWGVFVRKSGSEASFYYSGIVLRNGKTVMLGRFRGKAAAERFAEEMITMLNLKLVAPPRQTFP